MIFSRWLVLVLIFSTFSAGCSSARKMKEQRKRREAVVQESGVYCDFVKAEEDAEFEVEFNLRIGKRCEPGIVPQIMALTLDSENRGAMYCCKRPASQAKTEEKTDPAAEAFIDSQDATSQPAPAKK